MTTMTAKVSWNHDLNFTCSNERNDTFVLDGNKQTLSPMEALLCSAGACSSVDVVDILMKGRFNLVSCDCELTAKRAETAPQVFTHIHAHYKVGGPNLTDKAVARAVALSAEKYCSVMKMLEANVEITTEYSIAHTA